MLLQARGLGRPDRYDLGHRFSGGGYSADRRYAGLAPSPLLLAAIEYRHDVSDSYVLMMMMMMMMMARFLAGVSAGLLWALPAGYAARMVPKHQKGREIAIAMVGIPLALPHGVRVGTFLGNPGHFRVWVKSVTWWGILRNAFRWMPPELRRHKRPQ